MSEHLARRNHDGSASLLPGARTIHKGDRIRVEGFEEGDFVLRVTSIDGGTVKVEREQVQS